MLAAICRLVGGQVGAIAVLNGRDARAHDHAGRRAGGRVAGETHGELSQFGTARRAGIQYSEPILGKTGTCTDQRTPTHLGWFGSFNDAGRNKLVVVVLLTGGRPVNGPVASGIAGAVYRNLNSQDYFAQARPTSPAALVSTQACCSR